MSISNPGSDEAYALGCTCARMDNGYGKGALGGTLMDGQNVFWYTEGCPVHPTTSPTLDAQKGTETK